MFRDDDKEGKDFVEASIDDIMKRAATKVGWVWWYGTAERNVW